MLLRISSYWSVLPHHTAGQLIIHFIISPTAYRHTHSLRHQCTHREVSEQAGICVGTQHWGTPKKKHQIIFQLKLKLPQTTHRALQLPTAASFIKACTEQVLNMHTHESNTCTHTWMERTFIDATTVGMDMKEIIYLIDSISPNVGRIILE